MEFLYTTLGRLCILFWYLPTVSFSLVVVSSVAVVSRTLGSEAGYGVCLGACPKEGEWVCDSELKDADDNVVKPDDATLNKCVEKTLSKGGAFLYKDVSVFFNIPLPSIYSYI